MYPSAKIIDMGQTIEQYSSGAKSQSLIFHASDNSIDRKVSRMAAASQLSDTFQLKSSTLTEFCFVKVHKIKKGNYGLEPNNFEFQEFNKQLGNIASEFNGLLKWTKVEF